MCAFLFVCFGTSSSISRALLLPYSVSSSSGSAFISSILQLLCFFIHPFSRSSRSCVSPSSGFSVCSFIHPLAPLLFHPSSNSSVSSSILSLPVFLLSPLARSLLSLVCFATVLFRGVAVAVGFW